MQQIINFILKKVNLLTFIVLVVFGFFLCVQSNSYRRSAFLNSHLSIAGKFHEFSTNFNAYFLYKDYYKRLLSENLKLRNEIQNLKIKINHPTLDSTLVYPDFRFYKANVINNTFHKVRNYLTLDRGVLDSIRPGMGVVTDNGVIGIVDHVSDRYARVISILNAKISINAQFQNSEHFGSLIWDGKDPNVLTITDLPRFSSFKIGDTVITGGRSATFPKGIPIGRIKTINNQEALSYLSASITLFNDMTNVGFVYVVKNNNTASLKNIEGQSYE